MAKRNDKAGSRLRKCKISQQRYIKVSTSYYVYRTKTQSPNTGCRAVPLIQMKGHWLAQAEFYD